jgi:hypothetical protein
MSRLKAIPVATAAVALSAGVAFAYKALPQAAATGLDTASEAAERVVPARPDPIEHAAPVDATTAVEAVDLPDAASHGATVSEAAKADDPTPDTNRGADVSTVACDNKGAAAREAQKPADAGPPADAGQPEDPGPPESVELPDAAPEDPGPPADPGKPDEPGRPN